MRTHCIVFSLVCAAAASFAGARPACAQAQDDLQPGVNTSALPPPATAPADAAPAPAVTDAARPAAGSPRGKPAKAGKAGKAGKAQDRIDLDTTQITGNKELPKVMYVVPWKRADLGDLTGKPANSLVDEVLQPVDRDVFNREERYYHTVAPKKAPDDPAAEAPPGH
jgi:hypothetical protein